MTDCELKCYIELYIIDSGL